MPSPDPFVDRVFPGHFELGEGENSAVERISHSHVQAGQEIETTNQTPTSSARGNARASTTAHHRNLPSSSNPVVESPPPAYATITPYKFVLNDHIDELRLHGFDLSDYVFVADIVDHTLVGREDDAIETICVYFAEKNVPELITNRLVASFFKLT